jgi:hypothetical protein
VRTMPVLMFIMLVASPNVANGQSFELNGSAGPTITDAGNSFAAGGGFSPTSRVAIGFNFERTHIASRTTRDRDVVSNFRGGTLLLGTAEMRFTPLGRGRFGPYGLAGVAAGLSRPNVNDIFPARVTNQVRAMFFGGGIHVPLGERISAFADARMLIGAEGNDGMVAVAPVRAGLAWRF